MPMVPGLDASGNVSFSEKPSQTNMLMAAAEMRQMAAAQEPSRSMPAGPKVDPLRKLKNKPIETMKRR